MSMVPSGAQRVDNPFAAIQPAQAGVTSSGGASVQALMAREAQDIMMQMMCARNFPRNQLMSTDRIINAFMRPALCEDATYAYARGGQNISGLSIRAAEVLAQNWGNIRTGIVELSRGNGRSEFLAYAQDLETGYTDEKRFIVEHKRDTKKGPQLLTDERDIYELGANYGARRKRACILAVIPKDVQDMAEDQIAKTLVTKAEVTPESIKALLEAFGKFGVTKEQIEKRIQRRIESMLPAQLIQMRRTYNSLKDGMSSVADWFEMDAPAGGGNLKDALRTQAGGTTIEQPKQDAPKAEPSKQDTKASGKKAPEQKKFEDPAEWAARLRAEKTPITLDLAVKAAREAFPDGLPLEVEAAYNETKEDISSKDGEPEL